MMGDRFAWRCIRNAAKASGMCAAIRHEATCAVPRVTGFSKEVLIFQIDLMKIHRDRGLFNLIRVAVRCTGSLKNWRKR